MHRKLLILLVCALIVPNLAAPPAAAQGERNWLSINASQEAPYHLPDGSGFEDRLVTEIFARLGIGVRIRDVPAARGLALLEQGEDDGTLPRNEAAARGRANFVMIPERALDREYVVFARNVSFQPAGWESLGSYRVGIMNGWRIVVERVPKTAQVTGVNDHRQLFRLLETGRVDVAVFNRWGGLHVVRELGLDGVQILEPPLASEPSFFFLHRRHESLAKRAADVLRDMKRDGTYDRIYDTVLRPLEQIRRASP